MLIFDQLSRKDSHLRTVTLVVLAGMGILAAGLWYVQVISYRYYAENEKNQAYRTVRIPAIRGKILDQTGQALAENQPNYQVILYLDELRSRFAREWDRSLPPLKTTTYRLQLFGWKLCEWKRTRPAFKLTRQQRQTLATAVRWRVVSNIVQQLSATLRCPIKLDAEQFFKHYTNQLALPLPLLTKLDPTQVARFQEMPNDLPGLDLEIQPMRYYPHGAAAAHLVGYLIRDDRSMKDEDAFFNFRLPDYRGLVGIEGAFDAELRGKAGVKSVLVNNMGYRQSETVWAPAEPGQNVVLTLDLRVQRAAEEALQAVNSKYHPVRGAVVVMDPNNGDILGLVSSPAYDPNVYIPKLSLAEAQKLADEDLKAQRNRATQENYHPGSIFKVVVSLACLEAGLNPAEKITVPPAPLNPAHGFIQVGRRPFRDTAAPGDYDFYRAFIKSSNTYFITNGLRFGPENIVRMGQRFHLGESTQLPTRQDHGGQFPSVQRVKRNWSGGDTANLCIGQGEIDVTPLQMAVMVSAIANNGTVFWPRLVDGVEPQDAALGQARRFPQGQARDSLRVSARTLQLVREGMFGDVQDSEGTGHAAAIPGFTIGAKTGTAQVIDLNGRFVDYITWFASFGPYENPQYVVVVMVEGGISGGGTCAPVAKKIYQALRALPGRRGGKETTMTQLN